MKFLFVMIATVLSFSSASFAADCPVKFGDDNYMDNVIKAVKATSSCEEGAQLMEACGLGASGDSYMVPAAERKCGLDFWKKLSASEKKTYNALQAKCDQKYANMQGTMYISFNAFCRLNVARLYSELYTSAE